MLVVVLRQSWRFRHWGMLMRGMRRARKAWVVVVLAMFVMGVIAGASAWAQAEVFGATDPNVPLKIFPSGCCGVDSENVDLAAGTRVFFIESMPKAMTVRRVMLGRFARGSGCSVDPDVDLSIYSFPPGSDLSSGRLLVRSTAPQPFGPELEFSTWLVDPTALTAGGTYAFEVKSGSEACRTARELSIAHEGWYVDGGERSCAVMQDGSRRFRLWHRAEEEDAAACGALSGLSNFDPTMPTGWLEAMLEGERATINTREGECSTDLGASGSSWREGIVCQFGAFTAPGETTEDGWYYGLPWNGPGLEGSPRDIYLELEPNLGPVVTPFVYPVLRTSATLKAKINPGGSPTHYHFEWGTDTRYGNVTPEPDGDAGESRRDVTVTEVLTGLEPTTTYHYRVVAAHGEGPPVVSPDKTFTTATAPANTTAPTISGDAILGEDLTASAGGWSGTQPIEHSYQWRRCDAEGARCADVRRATRRSYELEEADLGSTLRVVVTAANGAGEASETSAASAVVERPAPEEPEAEPNPPENRELPAVFGEALEGETLTAESGDWSGDEPIEFAYQWRACDSRGDSCSDIEGADRADYEIAEADVGSTLRVVVTATNAADSVDAVSDPTAVVRADYLRNTEAPTITASTTADGDTLTADPGRWNGAGPIAYTYRWQRCDEDGENCANIPHATDATYVLDGPDVGATLRVVVIAENAGGSKTATSEASDVVQNDPPSNTTAPSISGNAVVGGFISAQDGSWAGARPMDFTFQWELCDEEGRACADITDATDPSYEPVEANAGSTVRVVVSATSAAGEDSATSAASPVLLAEPTLENTTDPAITGTLLAGELLSVDEGVWTGTGTIDYAYQWQRCTAHRTDCVDIDGADGTTYELTEADVDHTLAVTVTATDQNESGEAQTISGQVRTAGSPVEERAPVVSGDAVFGEILTVTDGSWTGSGPITYAYQWQSCEDDFDCFDIDGATESSYAISEDDIERTLRAVVTATNGSGSTATVTTATADVTPPTPFVTEPPTIAGTLREGQELSADHGSWTGEGSIEYAYQWQRCNSRGESCADIEGATASRYTLATEDIDGTIRVELTATDETGVTRAISGATGVVVAAGTPLNTVAPSIEGRAEAGETLTAGHGTWTGSGTIRYAYQWQTCAEDGEECDDLAGASSATYRATGDDVGATLRVVVRASNEDGSDTAASAVTDTVTGTPSPRTLTNESPPTISGTLHDGETLTADPGDWSAHDAIEFAYQWRSCDRTGKSCVDIDGETASTLDLIEEDLGTTLRVVVTATSGTQRRTMPSDATDVITHTAPTSTRDPSISGDASVGETLVADEGEWTGEPEDFDYQWQSCDSRGENCEALENAEEDPSRYFIPVEQTGSTIRVVVTATSLGSSTRASSNPTDVVVHLTPSATAPPEISGGAYVGEWLLAGEGEWDGAPESFDYQWQACDAEGEDCRVLENPEGEPNWFRVTEDQIGATIRVVATATHRDASAEATSAATATVTAIAPRSTTAPTIVEGGPFYGEYVHAEEGFWEGGSDSFSYEWQGCNAEGRECRTLENEQEDPSWFFIPRSQIGNTIRVVVTATNRTGSGEAASDPTDVITIQPPISWGSPWITGERIQGFELSVESGWWALEEENTYAYQWQRCDEEGNECADIEGATSATYRTQAGDVGNTVRTKITATNSVGETRATSQTTEPIQPPAPPVNDEFGPPTIAGHANDGRELHAEAGLWIGPEPIEYAYQWQRCDEEGESCADIEGATDPTYGATSEDVGSTLRVVVEATNPSGSTRAESAISDVVANAAPTNDSMPALQAPFWVGAETTVEAGEWGGSGPLSFAYQWQRCDETGESCTDIEGARTDTYTYVEADSGATVRVAITASNAHGRSTAYTDPSAVIASRPLENTELPTIVGTPYEGYLGVDTGRWSTEPEGFEYQWRRCDEAGRECQDLEWRTEESYLPELLDLNRTLVVVVTAHVGAYRRTAESAPIGPLALPTTGRPQSHFGSRRVEGRYERGETLTAEPGYWSGALPITYSYQWRRCETEFGPCTEIVGATRSTYTLGFNDVGYYINVGVSARNSVGRGFGTVYSLPNHVVIDPPPTRPANLTPPSIEGDAIVTVWQHADPGTWTREPLFEVQWQRCDAEGNECVDIADATEEYYEATDEDEGATLRVIVTANNGAGSTRATSDPTAVIRAVERPALTEAVHVLGTPQVGEDLYAELDPWTGINFYYDQIQFQRCNAEGEDCVDTGDEGIHHVTRDDIGSTLVAIVTATNQGGSTTVRSVPSEVVPDPGRLANLTPPTVSEWVALKYDFQYFFNSFGTWAGSPDLAGQWQRCDPLTEDPETHEMECVDIPGKTSEEIRPDVDDIGYKLRLKVTATAGSERLTVYSDPTPTTVGYDAYRPGATYTGLPIEGETITAESNVVARVQDGSLPTSVEYRFVRAEEFGSCTVPLQDGEAASYRLTAEDVGHVICARMTVSIWRPDRRAVARTYEEIWIETDPVEPPPANDMPPTIEGTMIAGNTLTADHGDWSGGAGETAYSYQWRRCDGEGTACVDVRDATDSTYTLTDDDIDSTLRVVVTAAAGTLSDSATSAASSAIVAATPLESTEPPTISGEPVPFETLTADTGRWSGDGPITYAYAWEICGSDGTSDCHPVEDATGQDFTVPTEHAGSTVRVRVTATNSAGEATATSAATDAIASASAPVNRLPPQLTLLGPAEAGSTVLAAPGTWEGSSQDDLVYTWERCDTHGEHCEPLEDAFDRSYDITDDDIGSRLRVEVTAENESGEATATSELTDPIAASTGTAAGDLVYISNGDILLSDTAGTEPQLVGPCASQGMPTFAFVGCAYRHPRISPNGQMILATRHTTFYEDVQEAGQIVLMNRDGTEERILETSYDAREPTWTPGGTEITFTAYDEEGDTTLEQISADGSNTDTPTVLPTIGANPHSPLYTPEGDTLIYTTQTPAGDRVLVTADADGSEATVLPLGDDLRGVYNPSISPDGRTILFSGASETYETEEDARRGLREIYEVNIDGSHLRRITEPSALTWGPYHFEITDAYDYPQLLPSGEVAATHRTVTYISFGDGISSRVSRPELWRVDANGAHGTALTDGQQEELSYTPSRPQTPKTEDQFFGMATYGQLQDPQEAAAMQQLGIHRVRVYIEANRVQQCEQHVSLKSDRWEFFDRSFRIAANHQITVLPYIVNSACTGGSAIPGPGERGFNGFAERKGFAALMVKRYGPDGYFWKRYPHRDRPVGAWEIWNEPNYRVYWADGRPNPQKYAALLIEAARTIHDLRPEAQVLMGGIDPIGVPTEAISIDAFLKGMYEPRAINGYTYTTARLNQAYNAMAYHPYKFSGPAGVKNEVEHIRSVLSNRAGNKPLWITELGWPTFPSGAEERVIGVSEITQARDLYNSFTWLHQHRGVHDLNVRYVAWFAYRSTKSYERDGPCIRENCWADVTGLRDYDGRKKPAWYAYACVVKDKSTGGCRRYA